MIVLRWVHTVDTYNVESTLHDIERLISHRSTFGQRFAIWMGHVRTLASLDSHASHLGVNWLSSTPDIHTQILRSSNKIPLHDVHTITVSTIEPRDHRINLGTRPRVRDIVKMEARTRPKAPLAAVDAAVLAKQSTLHSHSLTIPYAVHS